MTEHPAAFCRADAGLRIFIASSAVNQCFQNQSSFLRLHPLIFPVNFLSCSSCEILKNAPDEPLVNIREHICAQRCSIMTMIWFSLNEPHMNPVSYFFLLFFFFHKQVGFLDFCPHEGVNVSQTVQNSSGAASFAAWNFKHCFF